MSKITNNITNFATLLEIAIYFRKDLTRGGRKEQDLILFFAHNGIGKIRLSMEFKEAGKRVDQD